MSNFASGQQSQTELRLYFGVCILQKFQQSGHRDGRFAFGGYSLRAGAFLLSIETFLKLLTQFYTGGLLDMGVGVHQHICRKPKTFEEANKMIDDYIYFYNHERIQLKTGLPPLSLRQSC